MGSIREAGVDIGGRVYTIASDDDYLTYVSSGFEPQMVHLFRTLARGSDVILDVGANIGCTAILFSGLAREVHAFEPSPTTFAFLERNVGKAGLGNVLVHNMGLGAEEGSSTLTFSPSNRSGGFVSDRTRAGEGFTVETIEIRRLDDVVPSLGLESLQFIKIDVEGFEGHVLRGGCETLSRFRPVVVLELNHWCLNALQRTSIPEFFDFLRSTFPILLAVDGRSYLDIHDEGERYVVMYHHILHMRFANIVAAFDEDRVRDLRASYKHVFIP